MNGFNIRNRKYNNLYIILRPIFTVKYKKLELIFKIHAIKMQ